MKGMPRVALVRCVAHPRCSKQVKVTAIIAATVPVPVVKAQTVIASRSSTCPEAGGRRDELQEMGRVEAAIAMTATQTHHSLTLRRRDPSVQLQAIAACTEKMGLNAA